MALTLDVRGTDETITAKRRELASRILDRFEAKLPKLRLLIVLDDTDAPFLKAGDDNRGSFRPVSREYYLSTIWPRYIGEKLRTINPVSSEATYHYDGVVHLHNSTCEEDAALAMTLAHELQHAIQFFSNRTTWAWNHIPLGLKTEVLRDQLGLYWHDFPVEYEARVVGKRVSQEILGEERITGYIRRRREQSRRELDAVDWDFIRDVDASQPYDCTAETKTFFRDKLHLDEMLGSSA